MRAQISALAQTNEPPLEVLAQELRVVRLALVNQLSTSATSFIPRARQMLTRDDDIQRTLNAIAKILSPLRRVPFEILNEIFTQAAPNSRDWHSADPCHNPTSPSLDTLKLPWALTKVCSSWRRVAIDDPCLWALFIVNIDSRRALQSPLTCLLATQLSRSRAKPLTVILDVDSDQDSSTVSDTAPLAPLLHACHRWRALHISPFLRHLFAGLPHDLINLRFLSIRQLSVRHAVPIVADFYRHIAGALLPAPLHSLYIYPFLEAHEITAILSSHGSLREVSVHVQTSPIIDEAKRCSCPSLGILTLNGTTEGVQQVLNSIYAPNMDQLIVFADNHRGNVWAGYRFPPAEMSMGQVTFLALSLPEDSAAGAAGVVALLRGMPRLQELLLMNGREDPGLAVIAQALAEDASLLPKLACIAVDTKPAYKGRRLRLDHFVGMAQSRGSPLGAGALDAVVFGRDLTIDDEVLEGLDGLGVEVSWFAE